MSSTNKTTNYQLSQFIGSDKPSWLNDINQDMTKIDTAIKAASDSATAAGGTADAANTSIGSLENLTTTAKTNLVSAINEVDNNADTATTTANGAAADIITLNGKLNTLVSKFNMNTVLHYTSSDVTVSNGTMTEGDIYVARNSEGSLYKVYGRFRCNLTAAGLSTITVSLPTTGISPSENYTVSNLGVAYETDSFGLGLAPVSLDVENNTIKVKFIGRQQNHNQTCQLWPCLIFNTNFGDITPIQ